MNRRCPGLPLTAVLLVILPFSWAVTNGRAAETPSLDGYWTNDTYTPLERPAEAKGKEFFTPEEAAAFLKSRIDRLLAQSKDDIHYDDAIWQAENYAKQANLRTSIIVEPRDGKLPPLTEAAQRAAARASRRASACGAADSAQSRSLAERCISWGNVGPPMMPPTYNANLQILQSRDHVVIRHEMMHDVRLISLDGRPHPGRACSGWPATRAAAGKATRSSSTRPTSPSETNFRGSPQNTRQDIFASETLHVVERFTLDRRATRSATSSRSRIRPRGPRPWSGEMPMRRFEGPIYEYACHEGNYGLANILRAARVADGPDRFRSVRLQADQFFSG